MSLRDMRFFAMGQNSAGGGMSNYEALSNKPSIEGVTLAGNKSAADLGLVASEAGKGLSTNDFTDADKAKLAAALTEHQSLDAYAQKSELPTKVSDLTNDSGFITKAVADLLNYYLKSETYTKAEVNGMISAIPKFKIEPVPALPVSDIFETTVYLVTTGDESQNLYTEYIYVGGAWEKLGTQTLDLSGYVTAVAMNAALTGYVQKDGAKVLSDNNYSTTDKNKLSDIEEGANATAIDTTLSNSGAAADAKATGDKLTALESENALLRELVSGIDAPIYRNASGNPATFADGYPANVRNLTVTITPTQSGSGDPSPDNIRPIVGVSSVSVTRTGKNILPAPEVSDSETINGVTFTVVRNSNGDVTEITADGTATAQAEYVLFPATSGHKLVPGRYILTGLPTLSGEDASNVRYNMYGRNSEGTLTLDFRTYNTNFAFTVTDNLASYYFGIRIYSGFTASNLSFHPMLRLASETDAAFEPYRGQSVTVPLVDSNSNPLTVYGGTLNVTTGELTVTYGLLSFDGTENWRNNGTRFYIELGDFISAFDRNSAYISNIALKYKSYTGYGAYCDIGGSGVYFTGLNADDTLADFKARLAATPAQILCELRQPLSYQLTPAQIATLSGHNTVATDIGTLSVAYRADTALSLGGLA